MEHVGMFLLLQFVFATFRTDETRCKYHIEQWLLEPSLGRKQKAGK